MKRCFHCVEERRPKQAHYVNTQPGQYNPQSERAVSNRMKDRAREHEDEGRTMGQSTRQCSRQCNSVAGKASRAGKAVNSKQ